MGDEAPRTQAARRVHRTAHGAAAPPEVLASGVPAPGRMRAAYATAGVDVDAGDRAVELMRARVAATHGPDVIEGIGGFGAAVALPAGYRNPVLVSSTDGVGTKTRIAGSLRRFDTIGQDLVAMCADDVVCLGARPLFFLDYVAVGRIQPAEVADLVGGVARGCELAGCALVGGETAEHPGLMDPDEFDLAGFCVGIAERDELLDGKSARAGDALVGIASTGLHSNGYSLVRALLTEHGLDLRAPYLEIVRRALGDGEAARVGAREPNHVMAALGDVLLTPTRIYAPDLLALRMTLEADGVPVRGFAHVTGGGLHGNVPRALPEHLAAHLVVGSWPVPSVFRLVAALGGLDGPELRAILNAGLGMVTVVPDAGAERAIAALAERGLDAWRVGRVEPVDATGARYVEH